MATSFAGLCRAMEEVSDARDVVSHVEKHGYALMRGRGIGELIDVLEHLGRVIHVEEVVARPDSNALLSSTRGLSFHTDHHRAERIVWYCIAQSDIGGESVLVDAVEVYQTIDPSYRDVLQRVSLIEHSIFRGDQLDYPMITFRDGRPHIYYSYWLAEASMSLREKEAFNAFEAAVTRSARVMTRLMPGDLLAIDNHRMLHGRTAIEGNAERHLRRYWLEA